MTDSARKSHFLLLLGSKSVSGFLVGTYELYHSTAFPPLTLRLFMIRQELSQKGKADVPSELLKVSPW